VQAITRGIIGALNALHHGSHTHTGSFELPMHLMTAAFASEMLAAAAAVEQHAAAAAAAWKQKRCSVLFGRFYRLLY